MQPHEGKKLLASSGNQQGFRETDRYRFGGLVFNLLSRRAEVRALNSAQSGLRKPKSKISLT